jgi:hypothetical protein
MAETDRLSNATRTLTWASTVAFALLGIVLFVAPSWSATRFPWNVSSFVTMTIGGWCLGTAGVGWLAARDWRWGAVYPNLVFLWSFAALEVGVLVWFRDSLRLDVALAWPYVGTLALTILAALVGVADFIRNRPRLLLGLPVPSWLRSLLIVFVVLVGFIAVVAALGSGGTPGRTVFPEPLSPFTLRAFGAFFLAQVVGALSLLWAPSMVPVLVYLRGGVAQIVPITAAALVNLDRFDFRVHPLQLVYIGAYVAAFVGILLVTLWHRAQARQPISRTE